METERTRRYKALLEEMKTLSRKEDGLLGEMDKLWFEMTPEEMNEVDPEGGEMRRSESQT